MRLVLLLILVALIASQTCPQLKVNFRPTTKGTCVDQTMNLVSCSNTEANFDLTSVISNSIKSYKTTKFTIVDVNRETVQLKVNGKCLTVNGTKLESATCSQASNQMFYCLPSAAQSTPKPTATAKTATAATAATAATTATTAAIGNKPADPAKGPFRAEHIASAAPYHFDTSTIPTPPPASCTPVRLEHLGRHAERHINTLSQFTNPISILAFANSTGSLKPLGQQVLKWTQKLQEDANFIPPRQLTPQGFQTSYELGTRLVANFPEIFLPKSYPTQFIVDATPTQRTQQTRDFYERGMIDMGANGSSIYTVEPDHCSLSFINLRSFDTCIWYKNFTASSPVYNVLPRLDDMVLGPQGLAQRFHELLFMKGFEPVGAEAAKQDFVLNWWQYVCTFQINVNKTNVGEACSLFTAGDGELLSYIDDARNFLINSKVPNYPLDSTLGCGLIQEILEGFTEGIADKANRNSPIRGAPPVVTAHLRFAHKETLVPLLGLLWIDVEDPFRFNVSSGSTDFWSREFKGSDLFMMGSNIQFVLYECGANFKVKVLVNEVERVLPGCSDLYCDWETFSELLRRTSCDETQHSQICGGFDKEVCLNLGDPGFVFDK